MRATLTAAALLLSLGSPLLGACTLPGAAPPAAPLLPTAWAAPARPGPAAGPSLTPEARWWRAFEDPAIDGLVDRATAANQELAAGVQRVAQARALVRVAGSTLLPQAGASGSVSRDYTERSGRSGSYGTSASAGLTVGYEVDLFGANRALVAATEADYAGSRHAFRALALAVQADTVATYVELLGARAQLAVARDSLAAQERVLQLVETRYEQGAVSGFDRTRQRSAVASARAGIPALEETAARLRNALAILLGRPPEGFEVPPADLFALLPPAVAAGLPADLLLRRPDLLAAEAGLRAADADVAAARAAFFPRIDLAAALSGVDLTGSAGIAASLAAGLTAPIFSAGRLEGALAGSEARHAELVAAYRQRILAALGEVEAALLATASADRREELYRLAAAAAAEALATAELRYASGAEDLLSVLDAQQALLDANAALVAARQARLTAAVDLARALGGGWTPDPEAPRGA